jgi:hypothetical protein
MTFEDQGDAFPIKIDLGEVVILHMDVVVEAPCPEIYIGPRRRIDPGPPTTRALADALARWQVESEAKATDGTMSDKASHAQRRPGDAPPNSDRSA